MSLTHSTAAPSSNFQIIINDALKAYQKRTKNDLLLHPLAAHLQNCNSPSDILAILQQQVQGLDQPRSGDERWTGWLDPTINVLLTFSQAAGTVGFAFSPTTVVFAGIGVLLSTAKDVRAGQETLLDIFERIEMFFRRLEMYIEVPLTTDMTNVIIEIMAEVLSILGIATKEIKQSRTKKYMKRLIGRSDMEDALKKLDKLTQEEVRMAVAENLRATHAVDESVRGVANTVVAIDNRVGCLDDRVAGVDDRLKVVDDKVDEVIHGGKERNIFLDQINRDQLRNEIHNWLSPPDPSTNHSIACGTPHKKTADWFFQGRIYQEWKATGSLLWVHGKPGSGKSVLCSTIIQDIKAICEAGNASMAYFYFDFRNAGKQGLQDLVRSLLIQLSAHLAPRCDILSNLYSAQDKGKNQPSDRDLVECLKRMLTLPNERPTYLILDALDESPNTPGIPSSRQKVLQLVKELVELCIPNIHICVTSRLEIGIRNVLEPLTSFRVSLHDQSGQKEDIADYVRSMVYSKSEQIMKIWRMEDKELVIKILPERADGTFRWVFCQLEVLRDCLPPSVRRTLDELPESLDETYERVLKEIKKPNRDHALRLLSCLVAAVRPLRVEELSEVLAVDHDDEEGIPRLNPNWRWEDEEQALMTSCSSLITIVESETSRVVQFSHFSVKEYLTSTRLATSSGDALRYYIALEPAHTILARACMSALLRSDNRVEQNGVENSSQLIPYAAEHWVAHAKHENVSSYLRKAMECLFDLDKPYFEVWRQFHDIDVNAHSSSTFYQFTPSEKSDAVPLYYAALCGFQDLVEHLILMNPQQVNANGGYYVTPLVAALAGEHFQTARILRDNGAHPNVRGFDDATPLHAAAYNGDLQMVRVLLEYKADANAQAYHGQTPLHFLSNDFGPGPNLSQLHNVSRLLLEHGADINARNNYQSTPLNLAAKNGEVEVVRVLLEHGADINARGDDQSTPLHRAAEYRSAKVVRVLVEHGADINVRSAGQCTLLHWAADYGSVEVLPALLEHGADINARSDDQSTPLHWAASNGSVEVVRVLIEHGADINARSDDQSTPLHHAAENGSVDVVRVLLERGADINARSDDQSTPLHRAAEYRSAEVVRMLIEYGADINARSDDQSTPLHRAAEYGWVKVVLVLLEHGADVNAHSDDQSTPLHLAVKNGSVEVVPVLLEHGASIGAEDNKGRTPFQLASSHGHSDISDSRPKAKAKGWTIRHFFRGCRDLLSRKHDL